MSMSLHDNFKERSKWYNNRSSGVFPVLVSKNSDTSIVFQNYWLWKNKISEIFCIFRFRSHDGQSQISVKIDIKKHNEISLKTILKKIHLFNYGTVEVEIISPENLGFPFPALLAFYSTGDEKSVVHTAGRILNSNEDQRNYLWKETNFLSRLNKDFSPFIFLFFAKTQKKTANLKINFYNCIKNTKILSKKIKIVTESFGSKCIYIDQYLNLGEKKKLNNKDFFISFEIKIEGVFGRFVVGNLHKKTKHHFTTHSFQHIDKNNKDFVKPLDEKPISTFLPIFNKKPLQVIAKSYPTNSESLINLDIYKNSLSKKMIKTKNKINFKTGGKNASILKYHLKDNESIKLTSSEIAPSRLNVNYNFFLKNSIHPTDIATGFKANVYPDKMNHWGSSILEKDWVTIIFLRNSNHRNNSKKEKIKFEAFNELSNIKKNISINSESVKIIKLNYSDFKKKSKFVSWKIKSYKSSLEVFWLSYNLKTGAICGEHSF